MNSPTSTSGTSASIVGTSARSLSASSSACAAAISFGDDDRLGPGMTRRAYRNGMTLAAPAEQLTLGLLRRSGRSIDVGCRACNHVGAVAFAKLNLPAALPLASLPRYINCSACFNATAATENPIYLPALV